MSSVRPFEFEVMERRIMERKDIRTSASSAVTRRTVLRGATAAAGATALSGSLITQSLAQEASPAVPSGAIVSSVEGVPIAYTTFPEPFTSVEAVPGSGGNIRALILSYSPPPTEKDDNQFWQELETRLGVTWDPELVPVDTYGERISTVFAGGDLPEIMFLLPSTSRPIIFEALDQGAFFDMTDLVESGGLDAYPNLAAYPSYLWDATRHNGRIWGVPKPVLRNNDPTFLRQDWRDALGFSDLPDGAAVRDMLVAMSKEDPDGNGTEDTWGLCPYGGTWFNFIINQMFRVPYGWRLNDDGTLTAAHETDEYRQALEYVTELYAAGVYHPDSASLNVSQATDLLLGGQAGMATNGFAAVFGPAGYRTTIKDINPDATLEPIVMPGHDGGEGVSYQTTGIFGFNAISAQAAQDEDRLHEILSVMNYLVAPFGSEEANFLLYGIPGVHSDELETGGYSLNDQGRADRSALVYPFLSENYFYYSGMPEEAEFAQKHNEAMAAVAVTNPTAGKFSATQGDVGAELGQLITDTYTAVVTGREPIESFDTMLDDWRSRGGDDIRAEYEEAIAAG
jgi:putative aldouronate transport system substrate-binding protein